MNICQEQRQNPSNRRTCLHPRQHTAEQWTYLFLWQNTLDTSEGHFHRILKLFLTNSKEKKSSFLVTEPHTRHWCTQQGFTSVYLILLMFHEFPERWLFRQHFASCTLHNRFHGGQTRADPRSDVKVLRLKMKIRVLVSNWILSVHNFSFYLKILTKMPKFTELNGPRVPPVPHMKWAWHNPDMSFQK